MNPAKIIGIVLIAAGCMGPIELKVQEKETVSVPLIVSAGAIAVGVFVLVGVGRK
jgi:hypothetical protein